MWFFTEKHSFASSKLLHGITDCHCHLLPGVDDGIKTLEETLHLLRLYEEQGIREVWLTPHVMEEMPNTTAALRAAYQTLLQHYTGTIRLRLAAEYMLDALFGERLQQRDLLPLSMEQNLLLVETSFFNPPYRLDELLEHIKQQGYHPVLAHPERYLYMEEKDYLHLKQHAVRFQFNLFSLAGAYGPEVKKRAEYLLGKGWVDYAGTDTHSLQQFERGITAKALKHVTVQRLGALHGRY